MRESLLTNGTASAGAMYASEHSKNALLTWGLRVLGFVLMFVGVSLIFRPLVIVADGAALPKPRSVAAGAHA